MVVGHNPGISELARMLCAELPLAEMPTAALCTLRAGVRSWLSIETAGIELLACDWPKSSTGARRQP
jgi:phosphohistidine phosphatase SixA